MTVLVRVECDLCGIGVSGPEGTNPDALRDEEGLKLLLGPGPLDGRDAHPACFAEYQAGRDPSLLDGFGGLCDDALPEPWDKGLL